MTIRVCDCCGKEMKKDYISFGIYWKMADVKSDECLGKEITRTPSLEYCEKCFSDVLEKLGLDKE
jgi:hypothetical protein